MNERSDAFSPRFEITHGLHRLLFENSGGENLHHAHDATALKLAVHAPMRCAFVGFGKLTTKPVPDLLSLVSRDITLRWVDLFQRFRHFKLTLTHFVDENMNSALFAWRSANVFDPQKRGLPMNRIIVVAKQLGNALSW